MKTTWLASVADWISISFEKLSPAAYRFLAAVLPYSTPLPVAWLTMRSAEKFLSFTPTIAFVFVFALEGIGLWFTSLFVDSIIDWIRSKNWKTFGLVIMFGLVVSAYVAILVNLNVTLEAVNNGFENPYLARVITLLCFLPLLTGVGNGYYKWKLEQKGDSISERDYQREREEKIRQERREDRLKSKLIQAGINPLVAPQIQYSAESVSSQYDYKRTDWRTLSDKDRHRIVHALSVADIMQEFGVSQATAYNWKAKEF